MRATVAVTDAVLVLGLTPGMTSSAGTWTADLALPLGSEAPSRDWAPADGCPY